MVRAAGHEVPAAQRHAGRRPRHELGDAVLHVVGVVVVPELTVVPHPDVEVVGVGDLVGGDDARPDGAEGVEGLAQPAELAPARPPVTARGDVDEARVAEHHVPPALGRRRRRVGPRNTRASSASCMKIHGSSVIGSSIVSPGADDRVRVLDVHVQRPRLALGVLPVVRDRAQDRPRPRDRREQPHRLERDRRTLGARQQLLAQPLEVVDDRRDALGEVRDRDHAVAGQDARLGPALVLEEDELHAAASTTSRPPPGTSSSTRLPADAGTTAASCAPHAMRSPVRSVMTLDRKETMLADRRATRVGGGDGPRWPGDREPEPAGSGPRRRSRWPGRPRTACPTTSTSPRRR